jgi:uncharacterized protein (TIGR02449 family)
MDEILQHLEKRIKKLIMGHHQLQRHHEDLHQNKFQLLREKETWVAKQHKAIAQIEALVAKLKAIEKIP